MATDFKGKQESDIKDSAGEQGRQLTVQAIENDGEERPSAPYSRFKKKHKLMLVAQCACTVGNGTHHGNAKKPGKSVGS